MPVTLRIASGRRWNRFETGTVTVSSEHAVLVKGRLGDSEPDKAYRALTAVPDLTLTVDGNDVLNGGLDAWVGAVLTSWTIAVSGAGSSVTAEATIKQAGAFSAKLTTGNVGGAFAIARQTIQARSGQQRRSEIYLRGDGTNSAKYRIQNLDTGLFLQSNGTWGAAANALSRSANTGGTQGFGTVLFITYTVESFAACGEKDQVTLQIDIVNDTQNTTVYADESYDWATFDCASLHGVTNVHGGIAVQLRSATDGTTWSTEGTFASPLASPAAYLLLGATVVTRWSQIRFLGTPYLPIEIGEACITAMTTPLRQYSARLGGSSYRNLMSATQSGKLRGHKSQKFKARSRSFRYFFRSLAEHVNARELFHDRPEGQLYPALIIPDVGLADVMLAQLGSTWSYSDVHTEKLSRDVVVDANEMPFAPTAA